MIIKGLKDIKAWQDAKKKEIQLFWEEYGEDPWDNPDQGVHQFDGGVNDIFGSYF